MTQQTDWLKYPTGKIAKGAWCNTCARYNGRYSTSDVIAIKDNKILLTLRSLEPLKGFWCLPGGYLDWNETVAGCAQREFREETGHQITNLKLFKVYSNPERDPDGRQNISHCFTGDVGDKEGEFDQEVLEIRWFDLNDLPEKMAFDHRQMIEDYTKCP